MNVDYADWHQTGAFKVRSAHQFNGLLEEIRVRALGGRDMSSGLLSCHPSWGTEATRLRQWQIQETSGPMLLRLSKPKKQLFRFSAHATICILANLRTVSALSKGEGEKGGGGGGRAHEGR